MIDNSDAAQMIYLTEFWNLVYDVVFDTFNYTWTAVLGSCSSCGSQNTIVFDENEYTDTDSVVIKKML